MDCVVGIDSTGQDVQEKIKTAIEVFRKRFDGFWNNRHDSKKLANIFAPMGNRTWDKKIPVKHTNHYTREPISKGMQT